MSTALPAYYMKRNYIHTNEFFDLFELSQQERVGLVSHFRRMYSLNSKKYTSIIALTNRILIGERTLCAISHGVLDAYLIVLRGDKEQHIPVNRLSQLKMLMQTVKADSLRPVINIKISWANGLSFYYDDDLNIWRRRPLVEPQYLSYYQ